MATGPNPWPEMKDPTSPLYRVAYSEDVSEIPRWFSGEAKDFVEKCLIRNPKERWTAGELLQHPFLEPSEVNCAKFRESTKKSPTSVMDKHFWDAMEVSESSPDTTENVVYSNSPMDRITGLIGGGGALNFVDWTEEENWVMMRSNETEDCSNVGEESGC